MTLQVIAQYILDKWSGVGPSMVAADPESRALATLAARIHDQYITPIQVQKRINPSSCDTSHIMCVNGRR